MLANEDGNELISFVSNRHAAGSGRVTVVISVSGSDGTRMITSQHLDAAYHNPMAKIFFDDIADLDRVTIGGNFQSNRSTWPMKGSIYFVEVYDKPFSEDQAIAKINETLPPPLQHTGSLSYIQTGPRAFQFKFQPPDGFQKGSHRWDFPDGTSNEDTLTPEWQMPLDQLGIPGKVTITARARSTSGVNHGYEPQEIVKTVYVDSNSSLKSSPAPHFQTWVFRNGEAGFSCFRIPTIIRAGNGDLLAFAEARPVQYMYNHIWSFRQECPDHAIGLSIAMKRSVDNGMTWSPLSIIAENIIERTGEQHVAQNITAVVDTMDNDYPQGKIVIVYNKAEYGAFDIILGKGIRRTISAWSDDHGHTWNHYPVSSPKGTEPGDITNQIGKQYNPDYGYVYGSDYAALNYNSSAEDRWLSLFGTLGHSIQLTESRNPTVRGRLFVTGSLINYEPTPDCFNTYNYVFWSDDHGKTWQIGGKVDSQYFLNEAIAVELENGDVLINSRGYKRQRTTQLHFMAGQCRGRILVRLFSEYDLNKRVLSLATFDDEGKISFKYSRPSNQLPMSQTAAGMIRITKSTQKIFGSSSRIAVTGPDDRPEDYRWGNIRRYQNRTRMALWMSRDEGKNWNAYGSTPKLLNPYASSYSDIVALPDTRVGVLYEGGLSAGVAYGGDQGGILFASASLHWLSDGADQRALVRRDASSTSFDGSSGFVDLSSSVGEVDDMTEGSVVVSFKTDGAAAGQTLFSVSDSSDTDSVWGLVQTGDGRFGVYARNDSTDVNLTHFDQDLVTDGLWHQMAVTVGSDGTHIYVDGEHVAHTESTGFFADVDGLDVMDLGRVVISGGAAGFWDGSIGMMEVFDGVLTAEQAVAATQPAAMPVAAFHVDQDLTTDQAISMATAPGGTDLVADHLPQWECNELAASWAIGTTFTAPDSVTDQATVFQSEDSVTTSEGNASTASLMLGIWGPDGGERIGLRYDSPVASEWDLSVPFDAYSGQKVSMIAVMGPVNSYLIINGQTVATTPTPVPEGPHIWHPANTTIGTTNTDHALGTNLKTLAIWKGVVPSTPLAQSLTLAHNITR